MNIFKDSVIFTLSKGIRSILALIFTMLIARNFSFYEFGTYKQLNLVINLSLTFFTLGVPTTISYFYINFNHKQKTQLLSNTIILMLLMSVFQVILIFLFHSKIALILNNENLRNYFSLLSAYLFIMIFSSFIDNIYVSSSRTIILGITYIIYSSIYFLVLFIIILKTKSLMPLLLSMTVLEFIRSIFMLIYILKKEQFQFNINSNLFKEQLYCAIPMGVAMIMQNLGMYIDNIFVSKFFSPVKYALYANGAMDVPLVGIVTISVSTVILPVMSKAYNTENDIVKMLKVWGDSAKNVALIMFPIFWILLMFKRGYILFIFSDRYIQSIPVFLVYLLKFPLYCTVFGNALIAMKKQNCILYNMIIGIILNVTLNFILIKPFGMLGCAVSAVTAQYIIVLLQLIQISKYTKISIMNLLPYKNLFKIFAIPGIISFIIYLLSKLLSIGYVNGFFVFGLLLFLFSQTVYYKLRLFDNRIYKINFLMYFKK